MKLFAKLVDDFKGTEDQERAMNFLEFAQKHKVLVSKVNHYPCTPLNGILSMAMQRGQALGCQALTARTFC